MAGLGPAIHVFRRAGGKYVDGRAKPGHDGRGFRHEAVHRAAARLFAAVAAGSVADHLLLRPRHRRSGSVAGGTRRQRGGYRRHSSEVRPRSAALDAIRAVHGQPVPRRSRAVVLLPDAGVRPVSGPAAELAAAGPGRHGVFAAGRHPERHPRRGERGPLLGQRRKAVRAARPVAAVVLRRPGDDPAVLGLSGLAAVIRRRRRAAYHHAGLRARLVFRRRPHAPDAIVDAGGAGLGIREAGAAQGPAAERW